MPNQICVGWSRTGCIHHNVLMEEQDAESKSANFKLWWTI